MTDKEIQKGNRLISRFMKLEPAEDGGYWIHCMMFNLYNSDFTQWGVHVHL